MATILITLKKLNIMKTLNAIKKLNNLNINYRIISNNDHNKDIVFTTNGFNCKLGFTSDKIEDYCIEFDFENDFQETRRRFFTNLNQLLRYTNFLPSN